MAVAVVLIIAVMVIVQLATAPAAPVFISEAIDSVETDPADQDYGYEGEEVHSNSPFLMGF